MATLSMETEDGLTIDLDGFLNHEAGLQVLAGVSGFGLPAIDTQWGEGAGDGARYRGRRVLPRDIDLPLLVSGDGRDGLRDAVRELSLAMRGKINLIWSDDDGQSWAVECYRVGGGDYVYGQDTYGEDTLLLSVTLRAGDPFWTRTTSDVITVGQRSTGVSMLDDLSALNIIDAEMDGSLQVNNVGDAPTYPTFIVNGPVSTVLLKSPSGKKVEWTGTLRAGETLTFDMGEGTVRDHRGYNRYGGLSPAPQFWAFEPGISTATLLVTGGSAGTVTDSEVVRRNLAMNPRFVDPANGALSTGGTLYPGTNGESGEHPLPMQYVEDINYAIDPFCLGDVPHYDNGGKVAVVRGMSSGNAEASSVWRHTVRNTSDTHQFTTHRFVVDPAMGDKVYARFDVEWPSSQPHAPYFQLYGRGAAEGSIIQIGDGTNGGRVTVQISADIIGSGQVTLHSYLGSPADPATGEHFDVSNYYMGYNENGAAFSGDKDDATWTGERFKSPSMKGVRMNWADQSVTGDYPIFQSSDSAGDRVVGVPCEGRPSGEKIRVSCWAKVQGGRSSHDLSLEFGSYYGGAFTSRGFVTTVRAYDDEWVLLRGEFESPGVLQLAVAVSTPNMPNYSRLYVSHWLVEPTSVSDDGEWFAGDFADRELLRYDWTGTPQRSASTATSRTVSGRTSVSCQVAPRRWMIV